MMTATESSHSSFARYAPRLRAERLIAGSRAAMAAFSLLAIWLDPSEPAKFAQATYALLALYVAYATSLAIGIWRLRSPRPTLGLLTHVFDLAFFSLVMYLTEGATSPFFVFFTFSMVAATLRWRWRGTLWTAAAAILVFNGMGWYAAQVLRDPSFELNRFIIRSVYMCVMAGLLAYLGAYKRRLREDIARLAEWHHTAFAELPEAIGRSLELAAGALRSPRALLLWEDPDEPSLGVALWAGGEVSTWRESPDSFRHPVAADLTDQDFICWEASRPDAHVLYALPGAVGEWQGTPIHRALASRFGINSALSLRLHSEFFDGRLFALDAKDACTDDLAVGKIVARQVVDTLDQVFVARHLKLHAAVRERQRLSRELHDGVLQLLTGAALKLKDVERLCQTDAATATERLREIRQFLAAEHQDLRFQLSDLRSSARMPADSVLTLKSRLTELARRAQSVWDLEVVQEVEPLGQALPDDLLYEICRITQEAVANAARHGGATLVTLTIGEREGSLRLVISDNGCGFRFKGRHDDETLALLKLGPLTLKERVNALGGKLAIHSGERGARLEIDLPVTSAVQ